jgi:HK97 family phage portal protein
MRIPLRALFEQKSGGAIGSAYELAQYLLGGAKSRSGSTVSEQTALNVAAVMTCVSLRSRALASLPVRVYERIDERSKRPAPNHPVSRVLSQPNSWQTRTELFGMLEAHRVLRGNAFAWKNMVRAISPGDGQERDHVQELIPMHPDRVEIIDAPDDFGGPTQYKLHRAGGTPILMRADEVIHLKGLSTDGRRGRSVLQDAREIIGGAIATQDYASNFWSKDATPTIALKHPKTLSDKAKKGLEDAWERTYSGKDGKRVAVIEEGMEIQQLSLTAHDSQFLETRKFQRSEIAGWFHVPPHMIGDTEKSTSWGTGIEQQQIGFNVFTLRPDLVNWEQRLTLDLIQRPEKFYIEFAIEGLMRGDSASRGQFYRVMREVGAYSANDIRGFENLNPIENGDTYLQPSNLAPLGSVPPPSGGGQA